MFARVKSYCLQNPWLCILLIVSIAIRIPYLGHAFLLRGERDIVLTGLSLLETGKDLYSNSFPVQFKGLDQPSPFVSFYVSALSWLLLPFKNVFFARLPFMLLASLNTILVYELIRKLSGSQARALITTAIYVLSPGYFHISMLALEMNVAFPLLLGGMIAYFNERKIFGWILLIISSMTYNGFRPLIPFLVVYMEVWFWMKHGSFSRFVKNALSAGAIFALVTAGTLLWIDGDIVTSRGADIAFVNYSDITPRVDFRRITTVAPVLVSRALDNKYTETLRYMRDVFFEGQSLHFLFFKGDSAALYATTFSGQFFATFLIFYYLGWVSLGVYKEKQSWYILGFIPVALIPSIINVDYVSVTIRSMLVSVSFAYLLALGIELAHDKFKTSHSYIRKSALQILILVLCVEVGYFTYNYTFRRPITMFESYFEHERQIANYMTAHKGITIYDPSPKNVLTAYTILNPDSSVTDLQKYLTSQLSEVKPTTFSSFTILPCPQSGKKDVMYTQNTLISEACLDPHEYDALSYIPSENRILYKDFSMRTAYFIYEPRTPLEAQD